MNILEILYDCGADVVIGESEKVTDADGLPIPKVTVTIFGLDAANPTVSGALADVIDRMRDIVMDATEVSLA